MITITLVSVTSQLVKKGPEIWEMRVLRRTGSFFGVKSEVWSGKDVSEPPVTRRSESFKSSLFSRPQGPMQQTGIFNSGPQHGSPTVQGGWSHSCLDLCESMRILHTPTKSLLGPCTGAKGGRCSLSSCFVDPISKSRAHYTWRPLSLTPPNTTTHPLVPLRT